MVSQFELAFRPSSSFRCVPALSKIWSVRARNAGVLIVIETRRVFGARHFRPFEVVAHINDARSPRRRESAFILDRELDPKELVLVIGIHRTGGTPILLEAAFQI